MEWPGNLGKESFKKREREREREREKKEHRDTNQLSSLELGCIFDPK